MLAAPAQYLIHALLTLQGNYNLVLKIDISPKEYHHRTCKVDLTLEGYYHRPSSRRPQARGMTATGPAIMEVDPGSVAGTAVDRFLDEPLPRRALAVHAGWVVMRVRSHLLGLVSEV